MLASYFLKTMTVFQTGVSLNGTTTHNINNNQIKDLERTAVGGLEYIEDIYFFG